MLRLELTVFGIFFGVGTLIANQVYHLSDENKSADKYSRTVDAGTPVFFPRRHSALSLWIFFCVCLLNPFHLFRLSFHLGSFFSFYLSGSESTLSGVFFSFSVWSVFYRFTVFTSSRLKFGRSTIRLCFRCFAVRLLLFLLSALLHPVTNSRASALFVHVHLAGN